MCIYYTHSYLNIYIYIYVLYIRDDSISIHEYLIPQPYPKISATFHTKLSLVLQVPAPKARLQSSHAWPHDHHGKAPVVGCHFWWVPLFSSLKDTCIYINMYKRIRINNSIYIYKCTRSRAKFLESEFSEPGNMKLTTCEKVSWLGWDPSVSSMKIIYCNMLLIGGELSLDKQMMKSIFPTTKWEG